MPKFSKNKNKEYLISKKWIYKCIFPFYSNFNELFCKSISVSFLHLQILGVSGAGLKYGAGDLSTLFLSISQKKYIYKTYLLSKMWSFLVIKG